MPLARLGDSGRHTECACYFGCGLAALGIAEEDEDAFRSANASFEFGEAALVVSIVADDLLPLDLSNGLT